MELLNGIAKLFQSVALHQTFMPVPNVDIFANTRQGRYDRDPTKHPRVELQFGNIGNGPLKVEEIHLCCQGSKIDNISDVLGPSSKKWEIGTEYTLSSSGMYGSKDKSTFCTIYPTNGHENDEEWYQDFLNTLKKHEIKVSVKYQSVFGWSKQETMYIF